MPRASRAVACAVALPLLLAVPAMAGEDAAKLYTARCQACHGIDGKSPFPELSFLDDKWIHGGSLEDIAKVIENGVPGKAMLPFKEQFTKAEIDALARHVRSFSKKGKAGKGGSDK